MKLSSLLVFAVVLSFSISARAQQPAAGPRPVGVEDALAIRGVADPQVSEDGQWVAYTVKSALVKEDKNETRIWMIPAAGGEAIALTGEGVSSSHARFSPDGKFVAFLSARAGGKQQLWMLNRLGGEAQRATETAQGVDDFAWAPDSRRVLLVLRDATPEELEAAAAKDKEAKKEEKPGRPWVMDRLQFKRDTVGYLERYRAHLYVFDLAAKALTQITSGDYDDEHPAWSPDGKSVAFTSNRTAPDPDRNYNNDIWVVAADNTDKGARLTRITTNAGDDDYAAWSPDGKWISFVSQTDVRAIDYATHHLAVAPAAGGEERVLTAAFDRNVSNPQFSADGKSIYFIADDDGTLTLCAIPAAGGEISRAIGGRVTVSDYALGKTGLVAATVATLDRAEEVHTLSAGKLARITHVNDALFAQFKLSTGEYVRFKSKDGTTVSGYLYKPLDYVAGKKYPALLRPHGGPVWAYYAEFDHLAQLFAANGYVVLLPNPRGSSGYGQKFCEAIFADWGNKDFQDDMALVDYAVAQGLADADKLGVGGWSYGGISTNFIITQTKRFKAAISGASEFLYVTNYGHDHYQRLWEWELGLPWENRALWEKMSPFNKVTAIATPTLVMGGNIDWNVPIINSEQLYQSLRRIGVPTELVVYPGEYHGFTTPSHIKDRLERYLAWYGHYVQGSAAPARPAKTPAAEAGKAAN